MFARNLLFKILGCLLVLGVSTPTSAQDANNVNELSEQLAALQIMNDTVGPMLTQANTRNRQMLQYIGTKKMQSDWSSYQKKATAPANLSFADGYKIALQRVKTEQPVTSNTASASDLSRNISATKSMVEAEWKSYNTANANAKQMSAFLESKDSLTDYESWSKTYSQKRAADHAARAQAENEKEATAAQRTSDKFKAQQRYLMQHWDEEMHLKGLANSSGYIMERNKGSIVADSHEYPYLDTQTEPVNLNTANEPFGEGSGYGGSNGPGYYDGSWNGGYADPYYDVWGFPGDHKDGDTAYKRTVAPDYHPGALESGARSMKGAGRK
jgi:hypothetical protein